MMSTHQKGVTPLKTVTVLTSGSTALRTKTLRPTGGVIKEDLGLKFVTFTANKFRHILRDLLEQRQSRVELYRGSAGSWSLAKRGSPGNLRAFEDMVDMSAKESAPALALMLGAGAGGAKRVGVTFAENGANLIRTVEFDDDEQFSQLET